MAYTIETSVSLDGAVNAAMNGAIKPIAQSVGEAKPRFASTKTSWLTVERRRVTGFCLIVRLALREQQGG
jgi:hypothetical protein